MVAEVEGTPNADARALFEVDFGAAVGVSLAAVKFFREMNPPGKGGIIQYSSMSGFLGPPGFRLIPRGECVDQPVSKGQSLFSHLLTTGIPVSTVSVIPCLSG